MAKEGDELSNVYYTEKLHSCSSRYANLTCIGKDKIYANWGYVIFLQEQVIYLYISTYFISLKDALYNNERNHV